MSDFFPSPSDVDGYPGLVSVESLLDADDFAIIRCEHERQVDGLDIDPGLCTCGPMTRAEGYCECGADPDSCPCPCGDPGDCAGCAS